MYTTREITGPSFRSPVSLSFSEYERYENVTRPTRHVLWPNPTVSARYGNRVVSVGRGSLVVYDFGSILADGDQTFAFVRRGIRIVFHRTTDIKRRISRSSSVENVDFRSRRVICRVLFVKKILDDPAERYVRIHTHKRRTVYYRSRS